MRSIGSRGAETEVDFGDILSRWENERKRDIGGKGKPKATRGKDRSEREPRPELSAPPPGLRFEDLLDRFPPVPGEHDRDADGDDRRSAGRRALRKMAPQARLDLHGMNAGEAEAAIRRFLADSRRQGLRKVLIIHGKGNHSSGEPVLGNTVRRVLERCSFAGEFGEPDRSLGGRGALWVILR